MKKNDEDSIRNNTAYVLGMLCCGSDQNWCVVDGGVWGGYRAVYIMYAMRDVACGVWYSDVFDV